MTTETYTQEAWCSRLPWFKVDDGIWSHPKFAVLSDAAQALWLRGGSYASGHLTDGVLADALVRGVLAGKPRAVAELVEAGLWDRVPGGVRFHDWEEYQPSAESVKRSREQAAERMRNVRANRQRSSPNPVPVPGPDPRQTDNGDTPVPVTEVDARENDTDEGFIRAQAAKVGIRNLRRCRRAIHRVVGPLPSDAHLIDMVAAIIQLANEPVRSVEAYVETACLNSPDEVRDQLEECRARWPKEAA